MRQIILFAFVFLTLVQGSIAQDRNANPNARSDNAQTLSTAGKNAVMQAIVDEMYAHHLQGFGFDVGKQVSNSEYQLNAYFKPTLDRNGEGWVIYKLMPYGEVLRLFTWRNDGLAVLYGKLRDHFPPTQPSYLTVYMDDDELCQLKREWSKEHLAVNLKPSAERFAEALARDR